jgi:hypothetical protein
MVLTCLLAFLAAFAGAWTAPEARREAVEPSSLVAAMPSEPEVMQSRTPPRDESFPFLHERNEPGDFSYRLEEGEEALARTASLAPELARRGLRVPMLGGLAPAPLQILHLRV